eukprot:CAMPEP_0172796786 /NCGR_PEP_ID=MMETSP1074-20121228/211161_1 /TAXON_ID=2916 /ORGANISM="Ceratium fusus, Strain PA161109" /LENGTH=84 /DNA_ID=CAMNT_0013633879 /DNA_START=243 /DNA_END=497 /DNA_ORIENTATION=-
MADFVMRCEALASMAKWQSSIGAGFFNTHMGTNAPGATNCPVTPAVAAQLGLDGMVEIEEGLQRHALHFVRYCCKLEIIRQHAA